MSHGWEDYYYGGPYYCGQDFGEGSRPFAQPFCIEQLDNPHMSLNEILEMCCRRDMASLNSQLSRGASAAATAAASALPATRASNSGHSSTSATSSAQAAASDSDAASLDRIGTTRRSLQLHSETDEPLSVSEASEEPKLVYFARMVAMDVTHQCISKLKELLATPPPLDHFELDILGVARQCAFCHVAPSESDPHLVCDTCESLWYCSRKCMYAHFVQHRPECKAMAASRRALLVRDAEAERKFPGTAKEILRRTFINDAQRLSIKSESASLSSEVYGLTALAVCARECNDQFVELLLLAGANPTLEGLDDNHEEIVSALEIAEEECSEQLDFIQFLIDPLSVHEDHDSTLTLEEYDALLGSHWEVAAIDLMLDWCGAKRCRDLLLAAASFWTPASYRRPECTRHNRLLRESQFENAPTDLEALRAAIANIPPLGKPSPLEGIMCEELIAAIKRDRRILKKREARLRGQGGRGYGERGNRSRGGGRGGNRRGRGRGKR